MRGVVRGEYFDKEKRMLGNFTYCNPTKLYFGESALDGLKEEQIRKERAFGIRRRLDKEKRPL